MCGFALTAACMVHVWSITAAVSAEIDTLQVALTLLLLLHTHHSVFGSLLDAMCFHSGRVAGSFEMQTLIRNTRTYISEDGGWLRQRSACPHACPIAHPASRLSGLPEQLQLEAGISPCASLLGREG